MDERTKEKLWATPIQTGDVRHRVGSAPNVFEADGYETMAKLIGLHRMACEANHMILGLEINTNSEDENDRARCANIKANFGKIAVSCMAITKQARSRRMLLLFGVDPKKGVVTLEIGA